MTGLRAGAGHAVRATRLRAGSGVLGIVGAIVVVITTILLPVSPSLASTPGAAPIYGQGSTWSQPAVQQWAADVATPRWGSLNVNYQGTGSTAGRDAYIDSSADFGVSEIPFQAAYSSPGQPVVNEVADAARRPFAYVPIAAGGTSFLYNLTVAGHRVTNLDLSPTTLADIFTGVITNWDDPAISRDNGGRTFPSEPIKVVVRSDGSGTSAQFTLYMASQTSQIWDAYCAKAGISPCQATSQYPCIFSGCIAQEYSSGVAGYVAASYGSGSIGYAEYAWGLEYQLPVASIRNTSGHYVQPTAGDVAIGLEKATINADTTVNLAGVYTDPDPSAYPVSSYSLLITPTDTTPPFNANKGATMGAFILYAVCQGQQEAQALGYSPLPTALVEDDFAQVKKIPGAPAPPALKDCNNPYVNGQFNPNSTQAQTPPSGGSHPGSTQATTTLPPGPAGGTGPPTSTGSTTVSQSGGNGATQGSNASGGQSGASGGQTAHGGSTTGPGGANPGNGSVAPNQDQTSQGLTEVAQAVATNVRGPSKPAGLTWLAGVVLLILVLVPPVVRLERIRGRRKRTQSR